MGRTKNAKYNFEHCHKSKLLTEIFLKNIGMTTNSIFNWTEAVIETCNKDIAGVQVCVWHPE